MISDDKVQELVQGLIKKSEAGQVRWAQSGVFEDEEPVYSVDLGDTELAIGFRQPPTESDAYILFIRYKGEAIKSLQATEEETEKWELLKRLHSEAEREVVGWDKALEDIEKAINSEKPIGGGSDGEIPF
jgi:hypothetical protein